MSNTVCETKENGQQVLFKVERRDVTVDFEGGEIVTDTGLLTVRKLDRELGVLAEAAARLPDPRSQVCVVHDAERLLTQQVYQLLGGYFDANDAKFLRTDPLFQTVVDQCPDPERPLASNSTLSRFFYCYTRRQRQLPVEDRTIEQECRAAQCKRIRELNGFLVDLFIKTRQQPPKRIVLDIDTTADPAHGNQQLTLWHGYYDQQQYLTQLIFDGESGFPLGAWLEVGTAHASWGAVDSLREIVTKIRAIWPDVEIAVRADTGFAVPEVYTFCETERLKYVIGYATNKVLAGPTEPWLNYARAHAELYGEACCMFTEVRNYQAGTWDRPRRIVAKCEVTAQGGPNRRFVVTNCTETPEEIYRGFYVQRGDTPERGIQELKHGLKIDRLSAHRFFANAFILQCHVLAYALWVLFKEANADVPEVAQHQLETVRSRLFKIGAVVETSMRRVWFHLSSSWPGRDLLGRVCQAVEHYAASLGRLWPDRLQEGLQIKLGCPATIIK